MDQHPWEVSPGFTPERLQLLAGTVAAVRAGMSDVHQPEKGDNNWDFGCKAYSRTCFAFDRLAKTGEHDWLEVRVEGLSFTLLIDGVPLKFYRGDAEHPNARTVRGILDAGWQPVLPGMEADVQVANDDWGWLMAVDTHEDGSVMEVCVFQANSEGQRRHLWSVPIEPAVTVVASITPIGREGVDLAPPAIGPKLVPNVADGTDGAGDGG